MCETLGLRIKWTHWQTLFEEQVAVDMRAARRDVKNMLLKQAWTVHWKKWAAKHECEELKEGVWLWPSQETGICERSRKGIMESLRNFNKVDDHCTLDVGHLSDGARTF